MNLRKFFFTKYNSYNISLYKVHQQQTASLTVVRTATATLPVSISFFNIIIMASVAEPLKAGTFLAGAGVKM